MEAAIANRWTIMKVYFWTTRTLVNYWVNSYFHERQCYLWGRLFHMLSTWRYQNTDGERFFHILSTWGYQKTKQQHFTQTCLTHWGPGNVPPFSKRHFEMHFLNKNVWISIMMFQKFQYTIFQRWFRWWPLSLSFSEPMMVTLLTHIWATQPQWVNTNSTKVTTQLYIYFMNNLRKQYEHMREKSSFR